MRETTVETQWGTYTFREAIGADTITRALISGYLTSPAELTESDPVGTNVSLYYYTAIIAQCTASIIPDTGGFSLPSPHDKQALQAAYIKLVYTPQYAQLFGRMVAALDSLEVAGTDELAKVVPDEKKS